MNTEQKTSYADALTAAKAIDTTTGMNGYPSHLKVAYTADTMEELRDLKEAAEAEGHEVSVLWLHRREAWALWERNNGHDLDDDAWMGQSERDWTITIDNTTNSEQEAFDAICGTRYEVEDAADLIAKAKMVQELAKELGDGDDLGDGEKIIAFLDSSEWGINYTVRTGQNGYSYDTHQYKTALLIEEREQEDED
jgi:hypothetical protein